MPRSQYLPQPNPTPPHPTQPNPTQPNPTQPNPTQPNLLFFFLRLRCHRPRAYRALDFARWGQCQEAADCWGACPRRATPPGALGPPLGSECVRGGRLGRRGMGLFGGHSMRNAVCQGFFPSELEWDPGGPSELALPNLQVTRAIRATIREGWGNEGCFKGKGTPNIFYGCGF